MIILPLSSSLVAFWNIFFLTRSIELLSSDFDIISSNSFDSSNNCRCCVNELAALSINNGGCRRISSLLSLCSSAYELAEFKTTLDDCRLERWYKLLSFHDDDAGVGRADGGNDEKDNNDDDVGDRC